jgi:hypothetical protein
MSTYNPYNCHIAVIKNKDKEITSLKEALDISRTEVQGLSKKVAEYQELGLTLEEIKDILSVLSENQDDVDEDGISMGLIHDLLELAKYRKAEEQGLLIKLPCKVGDTVYEIDVWFKEHGIITCEVFGFHYKNELSFYVKVIEGHGKGSGYEFFVSDIGKTVFLTREAAEEALKGGGTE